MNDPDPILAHYVSLGAFCERTGVDPVYALHACERNSLAHFKDCAGGYHIAASELARLAIDGQIMQRHDAIVANLMGAALATPALNAFGRPLDQATFDLELRERTNRALEAAGVLLDEDRAELQRVRRIAAAERQERERQEGI